MIIDKLLLKCGIQEVKSNLFRCSRRAHVLETFGYTIDIELRKDPQLSGFIIVLRKKVAAGMRDPK